MMQDLLMVLAFFCSRDKTAVEVAAEHDQIFLDGPRLIDLKPAEIEMLSGWGCDWDENYESWVFRT